MPRSSTCCEVLKVNCREGRDCPVRGISRSHLHAFAPGVIEVHARRVDWLVLRWLAGWVALCFVVGYLGRWLGVF